LNLAPLAFTPRARADVRRVGEWYVARAKDPDLGERWINAVYETTLYVREYPTQPAALDLPSNTRGELRRRLVHGFERRMLFYRFDGRTVTVTRIVSGDQDLTAVKDL